MFQVAKVMKAGEFQPIFGWVLWGGWRFTKTLGEI